MLQKWKKVATVFAAAYALAASQGHTLADRNTDDTTGTASSDAVPVPIPANGIVDDGSTGWTWRGMSPVSDPMLFDETAHAGGPDSYGSLVFDGTGVEVFSMVGPAVTVDGHAHKLGTIDIKVDGKPVATTLLKQETSDYAVNVAKVVGLSDSHHVLEVSSDSGWIDVDYIKVTRALHTANVDFANGFGKLGSFKLNGTSAIKYNCLVLTDGATMEQVGTAFTSDPVSVARFHSQFRLQFVEATADGIAFVLQSSGPDAMGGSEGSGLGYMGIPQSVAIKFDIYNNKGEGTDSTGIYLNGVEPSMPAINLSQTPIDLRGGHPIDVTMDYDGKILHVTEADVATGGTASQDYPIDLSSVLGTHAYAGFTGANGQVGKGTQVVLSWKYTAE